VNTGRITGPIFFQDTINSESYVEQILCPFFEQLTEGSFIESNHYFAASTWGINDRYKFKEHNVM
jgi:hypothetical protein